MHWSDQIARKATGARPPRSFVNAVWSDLIIASYAVPDSVLQSLLPPGLALDRWQGQAHVSLVAFRFRRVRVLGLAAPAPFGDFPQWNLRFYVKSEDQICEQDQSEQAPSAEERGIVFVREFVPAAPVAAAVRFLYNEPYSAAPLTCRVTPVRELRRVRYDLNVPGQRHTLAVTGLGPAQMPLPGSAEAFFTGQGWGGGVDRAGAATRFHVTHPPWRVYRAQDSYVSVDFGRLYGRKWEFLQGRPPDSIVLCEGSAVNVSPCLRT